MTLEKYVTGSGFFIDVPVRSQLVYLVLAGRANYVSIANNWRMQHYREEGIHYYISVVCLTLTSRETKSTALAKVDNCRMFPGHGADNISNWPKYDQPLSCSCSRMQK
jgi:hypothetical protein